MNILALETSTRLASISVQRGENSYSLEPSIRTRQSKNLIAQIDRLLETHDLNLEDIEAVAFSHGPGSFTGIRIAAACCQALAYARQLSVIPVNSLQCSAQTAFKTHGFASVAVATNAFNQEQVYFSEFDLQRDISLMQPLFEPKLLPISELAEQITKRTLCLVDVDETLLTNFHANQSLDTLHISPNSEAILAIAEHDISNKNIVNAFQAMPNYQLNPYPR